MVNAIEAIDIRDRLTTVVIHRDEAVIQKIKEDPSLPKLLSILLVMKGKPIGVSHDK